MLTKHTLKNTRRFCKDDISLIENYNVSVTSPEKWVCHHRGGVLPCGRYSRATLKKFGLYYHRPASELIFLQQDEHKKLHTVGVKRPESVGIKISAARKGMPSPTKGIHIHSEAQKAKWSKMRHGIYNNGARKSNEAKKIPVVAYKNGVFFGEFSSNLEASKKTGVNRASIQRFLEGKISKLRSGFVFQLVKHKNPVAA